MNGFQQTTPVRLRRVVGPVEATLSGVGIILGAGIYALIGAVAEKAGNALWLSFLISGTMAAVIGICYAELASMFPSAGADYEYTRQAAGPRAAFVIGWLIVIANLVGAATVALGFSYYFNTFWRAGIVEVAAVVLVCATLVAFVGIRQAIWVSILLTLVEAAGLVTVIAIGIPHVGDVSLAPRTDEMAGVASGAALVMFAFIGFEQIATLAEETEQPERVVPLAMLSAVGITTVLYLLVAVAAVSVVGWERLSASDAPLAEVVADAVGDRASDAVAVVALFSTANTVLLMLVAGSRLVYGMASTSGLPRFLAWVHPGMHTPARAIALSLLVSLGFVMLEDISLVASATNFAVFVGFAAACLSVLLLRRRLPDARRPFKAPLNPYRVPVLPLLGLGLVVFLTANLETDALILGTVLFLSGVVAMEALSLWRPRDREEGPG